MGTDTKGNIRDQPVFRCRGAIVLFGIFSKVGKETVTEFDSSDIQDH